MTGPGRATRAPWRLALALIACLEAGAQPPATADPPEAHTPAVEELRARLEAAADLEPAVRDRVAEVLQQALQFAEQAQKAASELAALGREIEAAPERLKGLRAELEELRKRTPAEGVAAAGLSREALEERQRLEERGVAEAEERLREAEAALGRLRGPEALRALLADKEARLKQLAEDLKAPVPADLHPQVAEAQRLQLVARQALRNKESMLLQRELGAAAERRDLLAAQRDLAQRRLVLAQAEAAAWRELALQARQEEATRARQEAERAQRLAARQPQEIRELAEANVRRGKDLEQLAARAAAVGARTRAAQERTARVAEDFERARKRYEAAGLTETLGITLRRQRQELPARAAYRQEAAARREEIQRVALERIQAEEALRALPDMERRIMAALEGAESPVEIGLARARDLLADAGRLLQRLQDEYSAYLRGLDDLEVAERAKIVAADDYRTFIDKHLLWSRSAPPVVPLDVVGLAGTLVWIAEPGRWIGVAGDLAASLAGRPVTWTLGLLVFLALLLGRRPLRRRLKSDLRRAGSVLTDNFYYALEGLFLTAVIALPWPVLFAVGGWHLGLQTAEFTRAVGAGLRAAAFMWATTGFIVRLCRPDGVGQVHFRWPQAARAEVARQLRWFAPILVAAVLVIGVAEGLEGQGRLQEPGRLALMALMLALSVLAALLFRPGGALAAAIGARGEGALLFRTRHAWYGLAVFVPFVLFVLAGVGYQYTALQLGGKVLATTWLIVAVLIVNELMLRWLFIANRRLIYAEAKRRREAARKERREQGTEAEGGEMEALAHEEPELDRAALGAQTRALLRTVMGLTALVGAWAIWASVLPALQFFDDVVLWRYTALVDGADRLVPVSLTSLLSALVTLVLTLAAARNLPGVFELVVLGRIEIEPGTRYAISTVSRYLITAIGFVLILGFFGIGWSQVQWLVAALGVGLGFGLQEIFANFVSGLILLFEQPMRIGDIVTVGGTSGVVSRIRIRATTITDWDRRELVIPNKEFITGHFINWSLTDSVTRVVVPVGIAYGSDTALAEELLRKVARENQLVMEEPRPQVFFLGFGDNALNFELRVFTKKIDSRMPLTHQLHMAIDTEFRKAGINIAFPQRDIHLDASRPLEIRIRRGAGGPEGERP